uniref:RING-type domain-containing protein n=1 Tax=Ditylenchus dipsaci TaxID=166011 RepID=A0A915EUX3_9BILA
MNSSACSSNKTSAKCCSICFEKLDREQMSALVCGHTFHRLCIDGWFKRKVSCPVCNKGCKRSSVRNIYLSGEAEASTSTRSSDSGDDEEDDLSQDLVSIMDSQTEEIANLREKLDVAEAEMDSYKIQMSSISKQKNALEQAEHTIQQLVDHVFEEGTKHSQTVQQLETEIGKEKEKVNKFLEKVKVF